MRFAARVSAIFCQFEPAFGQLPGGGAAQHLTRLMGRGRALEVMLSAESYDADLAERYGWINRALPADARGEFARSLACRVARFPPAGQVVVKDRVNTIALAPVEDFVATPICSARKCVPDAERLIAAALKQAHILVGDGARIATVARGARPARASRLVECRTFRGTSSKHLRRA
jgi:hypothetical protein